MISRPALFLDLDGTVRQTRTGRVHPIDPEDQVIHPRASERIGAYKERGFAIVGVTNQGGVAFGILTEPMVRAINERLTAQLLPDLFDLVLYCPYHERGRVRAYRRASECRKPRPGMAHAARDRLNLDLATSVMVGDLETDREFAINAGIPTFYWATEFFGSAPIAEAEPLSQAPV